MNQTLIRVRIAWLAALCGSMLACGGDIVGIGNSGNRMGTAGIADEVARAFAKDPSTPEVTDEMVREIFATIVDHAKAGDPEAALIVLTVGRDQREEDD